MNATPDAVVDLLVVELAERRYALPLATIRTVHRAVAAAPVPGAPAIIEGAIDVRGQIVPVLDIRKRFALPHREVEPEDHLVVAEAGGRQVAVRVDRAVDIVSVSARAVQSASSLSPHVALFAGVVSLPDGVVLIHDLAAFLSEAERADLDAALAAPDAAAGVR